MLNRIQLRRIVKVALLLVAIVVSYCGLHLLVMLGFPGILFRHELTRANLTVQMRVPVPGEMDEILDEVQTLLGKSTLYYDQESFEIFIVGSFPLSRYLLLRNVHFGCNMPTGDSFVVKADVPLDLAFCESLGPHDHRLRSLSETMAHEITHALIRDHLGWRGDRRTPSWIKEGYCEFICQGSAIDHDLGLLLLKEGRSSTLGLPNFKHRLMVEYLLKGQGLTIEELLRSPPDYRPIEAEVLAELRADEREFLDRIDSTIGTADRAERWR